MERQTLRNWAHRFNENPSFPRSRNGSWNKSPDPDKDGVVRRQDRLWLSVLFTLDIRPAAVRSTSSRLSTGAHQRFLAVDCAPPPCPCGVLVPMVLMSIIFPRI